MASPRRIKLLQKAGDFLAPCFSLLASCCSPTFCQSRLSVKHAKEADGERRTTAANGSPKQLLLSSLPVAPWNEFTKAQTRLASGGRSAKLPQPFAPAPSSCHTNRQTRKARRLGAPDCRLQIRIKPWITPFDCRFESSLGSLRSTAPARSLPGAADRSIAPAGMTDRSLALSMFSRSLDSLASGKPVDFRRTFARFRPLISFSVG